MSSGSSAFGLRGLGSDSFATSESSGEFERNGSSANPETCDSVETDRKQPGAYQSILGTWNAKTRARPAVRDFAYAC